MAFVLRSSPVFTIIDNFAIVSAGNINKEEPFVIADDFFVVIIISTQYRQRRRNSSQCTTMADCWAVQPWRQWPPGLIWRRVSTWVTRGDSVKHAWPSMRYRPETVDEIHFHSGRAPAWMLSSSFNTARSEITFANRPQSAVSWNRICFRARSAIAGGGRRSCCSLFARSTPFSAGWRRRSVLTTACPVVAKVSATQWTSDPDRRPGDRPGQSCAVCWSSIFLRIAHCRFAGATHQRWVPAR